MNTDNTNIIEWDEKYSMGIELIDSQHKELIGLINQLYRACTAGDDAVGSVFKDTMHCMVDYVHFHFSAEQELLERVKYPRYLEHKKQHDMLILNILEAAKSHSEGKKFVANNFMRTLKDWVMGHIAVHDKLYATYIADQKKKGLLCE